MLDNYKDIQSFAYNLLNNEIKNDKLSHAYLFDQNNYSDAYDFVISFVKEIFCHDYLNNGMDTSNVCDRIDNGNFEELKIIKPDGNIIKKQQIIDLQKEYSTCAIEGVRRIYVIVDADKMRNETTNSMLKFLEEPDNNVIAILLTNNFNIMLPTIVSRCQVIKFNSIIDVSIGSELVSIVYEFLSKLENSSVDNLFNDKDELFKKISVKDRELLVNFFDILIDFYYDIMKIKLSSNVIKFSSFVDGLKEYVEKNTIEELIKKIDLLIDYKDSIKFNANINLLMDSLIVNFGGISDGSRY